MHKHRALAGTEVAAGQGHRHIAPVIGAVATGARIVQIAPPGLLDHAGQAAFDADAVQGLGQCRGGCLQRLLLGLYRFQARGQFGFVGADAVALQGAAQLRVLRFQAFDTLGQCLELRQQRLVVGGRSGAQRQRASAQGNGQRQGGAAMQERAHAQYPPFLPTPA